MCYLILVDKHVNFNFLKLKLLIKLFYFYRFLLHIPHSQLKVYGKDLYGNILTNMFLTLKFIYSDYTLNVK